MLASKRAGNLTHKDLIERYSMIVEYQVSVCVVEAEAEAEEEDRQDRTCARSRNEINKGKGGRGKKRNEEIQREETMREKNKR